MYRCLCLFLVAVATSLANADVPFELGYSDSWSVEPGSVTDFYFSGPENSAAELNIFDVKRQIHGTVTVPIKPQSIAETNIEPWINGYGFEPTPVAIPDLPGGIYWIGGTEYTSNAVPFIVHDPDERADVVVVYPTNTVNAYQRTPAGDHPNFSNQRAGVNLYSVGLDGRRPPAMSFHRPQNNWKVSGTRPFDRWMIDQGYDFKYISDADLENYDSVSGAKLVVIPGHSEYWTETARRNFDRFVDNGGSALVVSGNVMFRSVGYDDPVDPTQLTFSPRTHFVGPNVEYPTWHSIGVDYNHGGVGSTFDRPKLNYVENPYFGWKMLDVSPSYLADTGLEVGDVLLNPSSEYDGVPHLSVDPVTGPVVDEELLNFHRLDLIAFENTNNGVRNSAGTWIDFNKTEDSGRIITVGAVHWTPFSAPNGDQEVARLKRQITGNMIELLQYVQADFDEDEQLTAADIDLLSRQISDGTNRGRFDLNEDSMVDQADLDRWLDDFAATTRGDANIDGVVDFQDFLAVSGNFNSPAGWATGDFNGDFRSDFSDFLIISQNFTSNASGFLDQVDELCASVGTTPDGTTLQDVHDLLSSAGHLQADVDGDGHVGFSDFLRLSENFHSSATWTEGDLNCSGDISFADLLLLNDSFGSSSQTASVPEPSSGCLLLLAILAGRRLGLRRQTSTPGKRSVLSAKRC